MVERRGASFAEKTAFISLLLLFAVILVGMLGFFVNIPIGLYTLFVPAFLIILFCLCRRDWNCIFGAFIVIGALVVFGLICMFIYDTSFDGMNYQKQAIITLKEGWNPILGGSASANSFSGYLGMNLWIDHYPKGLWIVSAAIYSITNVIETAKAANILFLLPIFFLGYDVMHRVFHASTKKSMAFAVIFGSNPVFFSQMFTTYNDLAVGALVILTLLLCIKIYEGYVSGLSYLFLFIVVAVSCSIKFTAPILLGIILLIFGICYALKHRKRLTLLRRPVIVVVSAFLCGVLLLGFDPYIKHLITGQHILYPLMGEGKTDIMTVNTPKAYQGKSKIECLIISLFSKSSNDSEDSGTYKLPFTIYASELEELGMADIRIGGFGVLFSGILCFAILYAIIAACKKTAMRPCIAVVLGILLLLALFFPETWWARYASFIYYIPVFLLLYACNMSKTKWISAVVLTAFIVNSVVMLSSVLHTRIGITQAIDQKLEQIKADGRRIEIRFNDFPSQIAWFREKGIDFVVSDHGIENPILFYGSTKYRFID